MHNFWRQVHQRALAETRDLLGLSSWPAIMIRAILAIAVVSALVLWGSDEAARDETIFRAAAVTLVVALFPLVYLINFVRLLPEPHRTAEARISTLESSLESLGKTGAHLEILLQSFSYGHQMKAATKGIFVAFLVVTNKGNQLSSALDWTLYVTVAGKTFEFIPQYHNKLHLKLENGPLTVQRKDTIVEKTYAPIPIGGMVGGYFFTYIPLPIMRTIDNNSSFEIRCQQVDGRVVSSSHRIGDIPRGSATIMAGMDVSTEDLKVGGPDSDEALH